MNTCHLRYRLGFLMVLFWAGFAPACIIVPIPTDEREVSGNLLPASLVDRVYDQTASRADVLMNLGPPDQILGDDEVFIYTGEIRNLMVIWGVGIGASGGGVGVGGAGGAECVSTVREWAVFAFGPDGMVKNGAKLRDAITWKSLNRERLDEWLALNCPHLIPKGDE